MNRKFFIIAFFVMLFSMYFSANAAVTSQELIMTSKSLANTGIQLTSISVNRDVIVFSGKDANGKLYTYFYHSKDRKWQDLNADIISPVSSDVANIALEQMITIITACETNHLSLISANIDGKEGHYSGATSNGAPMMGKISLVESYELN